MRGRSLLAVCLTAFLLINSFAGSVMAAEPDNAREEDFRQMAQEQAIYALFYLGNSYGIKTEPYDTAQELVTIYSGQQLVIKELSIQEDGNWYFVSFMKDGRTYEGYIHEDYIISDNPVFNDWVKNDGLAAYTIERVGGFDFEAYIRSSFPRQYQEGLLALHEQHPNWFFVAHHTGLLWEEVIDAQMYPGRNLIYRTAPEEWKSKAPGDYDPVTGRYIGKSGDDWVQASREAVEYFMNPANFLDEQHIFQFEQLTFNGGIHDYQGVEAVLGGTWMKGNTLEDRPDKTYAQVFMEIGKTVNVSPYHLAGRIRQEQGSKGTSPLISGTYAGYEGYYNYFNVGATGTTDAAVIKNGLQRAVKEGWNTRYASLLGGAKVISANYIARGQDSIYLQKFDVDNSDGALYYHQYMQNIQAPYSESASVMKAYKAAGALEANFVFKIPVYEEKVYVGDINSELKTLSLQQTADGNYYLSGEIVVVEWVDGMSTVPADTPAMRFRSATGGDDIDVFVTAVGTNTYYFDRFIGKLPEDREYVFEIALTSEKNVGTNKSMNVLLSTSPQMPASALLGATDTQRILFRQGQTGEMLVYAAPMEYEGNINSELKNVELVKGANGNYVSGQIVVVEWVNGLSTVPQYTPVMTFRSVDGLVELPVYVTPTGTNTYYFDRSIGLLDEGMEYVFTVTSADSYNTSPYRGMTVTTPPGGTREGLLWETAQQRVCFKTDENTGQLRIYAVKRVY